MSDNIEQTKAAIEALPNSDKAIAVWNVTEKVYTRRSLIYPQSLKALAADHSALRSLIESAEIIQLRGGTLSKCTGGGWNVYLGDAKDAVHCDTALEGYAKIEGAKSV